MSRKTAPTILPLASAEHALQAAQAAAAAEGLGPLSLVAVDGTGWPVLFRRHDGAPIGSIDTALAKARTAAWFGHATRDLAAAVADGQVLATVQTSASQPLIFVAGGVPIRDAEGIVIGAIGVGGGSPDQDHGVAQRAADSLA